MLIFVLYFLSLEHRIHSWLGRLHHLRLAIIRIEHRYVCRGLEFEQLTFRLTIIVCVIKTCVVRVVIGRLVLDDVRLGKAAAQCALICKLLIQTFILFFGIRYHTTHRHILRFSNRIWRLSAQHPSIGLSEILFFFLMHLLSLGDLCVLLGYLILN